MVATVTDANYQGSASDTLVIAKANQTIDFPCPATARKKDIITLSATATSGLPVTFAVTSGPGTLSPSENGGTHGASWRFVVELGPEVKGWGTYPGGQSGNPVSSRYDDRLELWRTGQLAELRFPRTPDALPAAQTPWRKHEVTAT